MKILVLGGAGMLGHKMVQTFVAHEADVIATIRGVAADSPVRHVREFERVQLLENTDAGDLQALEKMVSAVRPDAVVNCVGIIKQRSAAASPIPSITINSLMPHRLAELLSSWGGRLVHFSTDCVFSGERGQYLETDVSDARDLYGRSKFLGEVATANALTLRTSIIGRELSHFSSLVEWFLSQQGGSVGGYTRAIYSGVTTGYLSEIVWRLLSERPDLSGLYQVTAPPLTKFELLCRLRDAFGADIRIVPSEAEICDRSMVGERFRLTMDIRDPSWDQMLDQMAHDSTPYREWRHS